MTPLVEPILRLLLELGADVIAGLIRRGAAGTEHAARVADMLPADPRALLSAAEQAALEELGARSTPPPPEPR